MSLNDEVFPQTEDFSDALRISEREVISLLLLYVIYGFFVKWEIYLVRMLVITAWISATISIACWLIWGGQWASSRWMAA